MVHQPRVFVLLLLLTGSATAQCENAELVPFDGAFADHFGEHVVVGGDTLVVGSPHARAAQICP